jgi:trans-2,3-dihydro-3-hydroxyanthranilate isomerase
VMTKHTVYQLDVFTRTPLTGNPLAVFPQAGALEPEVMQALAREMNLSETTFVTHSDQATRRVRFFTPTAEIPLAGHPTIGTWWLLAQLGELDSLPRAGTHQVTQETGRGVLPVDITMREGRPERVVMTQALPEIGDRVEERGALGAALGGDATTVADGPAPEVISTALPQMMIPIRSSADLEQLPSGGAGGSLAQFLRDYGTDCAMCFVLEPADATITARCRMFAPGLGVAEDPATGSAAGALGCYLVRHKLVRLSDGTASMVFEQGIEIGRPSRIDVDVVAEPSGTITQVRVGGAAVQLLTGEVVL